VQNSQEMIFLIRNNIFAILTHILCFIVYFIIAFFLRDFIIGGGILSIFMWCVYIFVGKKLIPQDSIVKNLLSVSVIGVLGLITWILGLGNRSISWNFRQLLAVFIVPSAGIIILLPKFIMKYITGNSLVSPISTLIPTILMWIGLQWKARGIKRKQLQ
jgi:hypothetical protein